MQKHIEALRKAILSEGLYADALDELKRAKLSRPELAAIHKELTGYSVASRTSVARIFELLAIHGNNERRLHSRAEFSRDNLPI